MVFGVVKGIQREAMTRSEEGPINSFDNFKVSRVEGRRYMHEFSFYCTVLIFTVFPSYALLIFSVNALPPRRSKLLWELWRLQLLRKLVKNTFLYTLSMMLRQFSP